MNCWTLPDSIELSTLLSWCRSAHGADRLLLANRQIYKSRQGELISPSAYMTAISLFEDRVLQERLARRWPGTVSTEQDCLIQIVEFDLPAIDSICSVSSNLFDWVSSADPPLPEDPCLFRRGATWPVLVSVTHERDAWLLSDERPPFDGIERSRFTPDELYIPPAESDFLG